MMETIEIGLNIIPVFACAYAAGQGLNYLGEIDILREKAEKGEDLPEYNWFNLGKKLAERKVRQEYL